MSGASDTNDASGPQQSWQGAMTVYARLSAPRSPAWPTRLITGMRRSVGRTEEVRNGSAAPFIGRGAATVNIRNT
jgi:hypothetical protein